jgi:hypothetical protein
MAAGWYSQVVGMNCVGTRVRSEMVVKGPKPWYILDAEAIHHTPFWRRHNHAFFPQHALPCDMNAEVASTVEQLSLWLAANNEFAMCVVQTSHIHT